MKDLMNVLFSNIVQCCTQQDTESVKLTQKIESEMEYWKHTMSAADYEQLSDLLELLSMREAIRLEDLFRSGLTFGLLLMAEAYTHACSTEDIGK